MTTPTSVQHAGTAAIAKVAADLQAVRERVPGAIRFARRVGMDDDEIRAAFEAVGVDFGDILAALEGKA